MTSDLQTPEGIAAWADKMMVGARFNFETDGFLQPVVFMLAMTDPGTGELLAGPGMLMVTPHDPESVDSETFLAEVREVAERASAYATLLISEAWGVFRPRANEEFALANVMFDGALDEHPERCKLILALLERPTGRKLWVSPITRQGEASTCGPFITSDWGAIGGPAVGVMGVWN
jgi:hypothetical protein